MASNSNFIVPTPKFNVFTGSEHTSHLDAKEEKRYADKLGVLGICDPYCAPPVLFTALRDVKCQPALEFGDIWIYLVENPSPYSAVQMKAYKSTDSYKYFVSGWVTNAVIWNLEKKKFFVVKAKVCIPHYNGTVQTWYQLFYTHRQKVFAQCTE